MTILTAKLSLVAIKIIPAYYAKPFDNLINLFDSRVISIEIDESLHGIGIDCNLINQQAFCDKQQIFFRDLPINEEDKWDIKAGKWKQLVVQEGGFVDLFLCLKNLGVANYKDVTMVGMLFDCKNKMSLFEQYSYLHSVNHVLFYLKLPCIKIPPFSATKTNAKVCKNQKEGYIYMLEGKDVIKIGYSKNPEMRKAALECSCPYKLNTVATRRGYECEERRFHAKHKSFATKGEWYPATLKDEFLKILGM